MKKKLLCLFDCHGNEILKHLKGNNAGILLIKTRQEVPDCFSPRIYGVDQ